MKTHLRLLTQTNSGFAKKNRDVVLRNQGSLKTNGEGLQKKPQELLISFKKCERWREASYTDTMVLNCKRANARSKFYLE